MVLFIYVLLLLPNAKQFPCLRNYHKNYIYLGTERTTATYDGSVSPGAETADLSPQPVSNDELVSISVRELNQKLQVIGNVLVIVVGFLVNTRQLRGRAQYGMEWTDDGWKQKPVRGRAVE